MPRLNGFQKPCNAFQISSYVLFGLCIGWFYVFVIPAVPNIFVVITFSAIFLANSLAVFVFTFLATKADLADINLKTRGFPLPRPEFDLSSDALDSRRMALNNNVYSWCTFCEWEVFRDSKHCRTCDRCVNKFDHHCRWINNCVAKGNYRFFIVSVASTNLLLLISLVLSVFALVYSFSGKAFQHFFFNFFG